MANNTDYHQANASIPGWHKLSIQMKASYFKWKLASDLVWGSGKYKVVASFNAGRRRFGGVKVITNVYQFDNQADASECKTWWDNYGGSATIHNV